MIKQELKELNEMVNESKRRYEEFMENRLEKFKAEYPEFNLEDAIITQPSLTKVRIYKDNKEFYEVDTYIFEMKTDLGLTIEVNNDLGWEYKEIEAGREILIVRDNGWDEVEVQRFNKVTGSKVKNTRRWLKVGETSKGRFIENRGKRVYI